MSSNSLQALLKNLTLEIEALWTIIGYRADGYRYGRDEVRTEVETGAPLLSKTKRPVRGTIGVSVATEQRQKDVRELTDEMLTSAMLDSTPSWRRDSEREREQDVRGRIERYVRDLSEEFANIPTLNERIFDAQGFKHYETHELAKQLTEERDARYHRITTVLFIADVVADELVSAGFDATGHTAHSSNGSDVTLRGVL